MPVPALKINDYIYKLNAVIFEGQRLGDLDRYEIEKIIKAAGASASVESFLLRAMLATVDGNNALAVRSMEAAVVLAPQSPAVRSNFALTLRNCGYPERAAAEGRICLALSKEQNDWGYINNLVAGAVKDGDMALVAEVIQVVGPLEKVFPNSVPAACLLYAEDACDEDAAAMLDVMLDAELRDTSVEISVARWAEMKKLADELAPYVD